MSLGSAFDLQLVARQFQRPVAVEEKFLDDLTSLVAKCPGKLHHLGLTVWHQIVHRSLFRVDPQSIGPYVESEDPLLIQRIDAIVGVETVAELYSAEVCVDDEALGDSNVCCELFLARTYPSDLVLGDVVFSDPYRPIPVSQRKHQHQHYKGLGLLSELMGQLRSYGRANGVDHVLLTAASVDQVSLFRRYGFRVDGSDLAKAALEFGYGIPMELPLP